MTKSSRYLVPLTLDECLVFVAVVLQVGWLWGMSAAAWDVPMLVRVPLGLLALFALRWILFHRIESGSWMPSVSTRD